MLMLGGKLFSSLVDSIWSKPDHDNNVMDIDPDTPGEQETASRPQAVPKRKLAEDAAVEVEKRRCGYFSRIVRPMRIMRTTMPSFSLHDHIPVFLYLTALKAKGKRLCPSVFRIPVGKRAWHAGESRRPNRRLHIPLIVRRSRCIFPRPEGKRRAVGVFGHANTKKLHKELDNQALQLHFRYYNWSYQPAPRKRSPRLGNLNPFRQRRVARTDRQQQLFCPGLEFWRHSSRPNRPGMDIDGNINAPTTVPLPELETLSLDSESDSDHMEGLEVFSNSSQTSFSSSSSWSQVALDPDITTEEPHKGPLQFFLRQLENLRSRPPFPSLRQSYSAWGPLSN